MGRWAVGPGGASTSRATRRAPRFLSCYGRATTALRADYRRRGPRGVPGPARDLRGRSRRPREERKDIEARSAGPPRRSLARRSRNPLQPKLCACGTCRQRPSGAATTGSDWTSSGAERGALQRSQRRKYRPISSAATGRTAGPSLVIQRSKTATASITKNAITGPSSGQATTIAHAAQVGRLLIA
jgi:hypothetical protein